MVDRGADLAGVEALDEQDALGRQRSGKSSHTMAGALPPSSSVTGHRFSRRGGHHRAAGGCPSR
jgi:hypothetical protein